MDLAQALRIGVLPATANPIDIILTAHKEGLIEMVNIHIKRHHSMMRKTSDPNEARQKFQVTLDFTESELAGMTDLKAWDGEKVENTGTSLQSISVMQSSLSILGSLRRKKIYRPIDDMTVTHCYKCGGQFTLFNRRHHCRACGRIFCYACSQWSESIPKELISYIDTQDWIVPGSISRVCQACKAVINDFARIEKLVRYFEIVAYPFDLCIRASTLSRDWREAMRIYLSNVRDIQYLVPSAMLADRDVRAIMANKYNFQGHSKWLLQALKLGIMPVQGQRTISCEHMMCDYNCTDELTPFDALIMLNNTLAYNTEVRLLALQILETHPFPPYIAVFLPIDNSLVQDFILKRSDLFLNFFWSSRIYQGLCADIFRNKLILANEPQASYVQESLHLIFLLNHCNADICELAKNLQGLKVPFIGPFGLIESFDHEIIVKPSATRPMIIQYYANKIKKAFMYKLEDIRKDAYIVALIRIMYELCADIFTTTEPFLPVSTPINIVTPHRTPWFAHSSPQSLPSLMHSTESPPKISSSDPAIIKLDQTQEITTSVSTSEPIRKDEKFLVTYQVMPVSTQAGFIEIIPNASTLSDILSKGTISNYLYRSNMNKTVREVSSNYSASLAFWTVITFLLGVGDRHLDNIMIRNDGILFHVDYGFVFGVDSTASFVRLDHNLIEGLGGVDMYEPFRSRCCEIYCRLRRYFNLICTCLLPLGTIEPPIKGYKFNQKFIEKFITERFLLGQTEEEAKIAFSNIIDASRETIINTVSDVIHSTVSTFKVGWWSY